MFVVKYCVRGYVEVWKTEVARFPTEKEAEDYADNKETHSSWPNEWYEVEEEK